MPPNAPPPPWQPTQLVPAAPAPEGEQLFWTLDRNGHWSLQTQKDCEEKLAPGMWVAHGNDGWYWHQLPG